MLTTQQIPQHQCTLRKHRCSTWAEAHMIRLALRSHRSRSRNNCICDVVDDILSRSPSWLRALSIRDAKLHFSNNNLPTYLYLITNNLYTYNHDHSRINQYRMGIEEEQPLYSAPCPFHAFHYLLELRRSEEKSFTGAKT